MVATQSASRWAWRRLVVLAACVVTACGGGGGGGDAGNTNTGGGGTGGTPQSETFAATFSPASVSADGFEGAVSTVPYGAAVQYAGTRDLWLITEWDSRIVATVSGGMVGSSVSGAITLRSDLAPGPYTTTVRLYACYDQACTSGPSGVSELTVTARVRENIAIDTQSAGTTMTRTGQEAAPTLVLPLKLPAEAGTVSLSSSGDAAVLQARIIDGPALQVSSVQAPAGTYRLQVQLQGSAANGYHTATEVQYVVHPPAGGQQPLKAWPERVDVSVLEGGSQTRQVTVTPPTWTDAWDPPVVTSGAEWLRLTDLGGHVYALAADASGLPVGDYGGAVRFSAGPWGGEAMLGVSLHVNASFYASQPLQVHLDASSTPASLRAATPIVAAGATSGHWSARSLTTGLSVRRTSGTIGVDDLEVEFDPAFVSAYQSVFSGEVEISTDLPGSAPQRLQAVAGNQVPSLQRTSATLVGNQGRLYVEGSFNSTTSGLLAPGALTVQGATLRQAQFLADTRFAGDVLVLALDVDGVQAGTPVVVRSTAPLQPTAVTVATESSVRVPAAAQALPYGSYRPAVYAAGHDALYFAGPDTVYRWAHGSGGWALSQAAAPGIADLSVQRDESELVLGIGAQLQTRDPATLAVRASGSFSGGAPDAFDATAPAGSHGAAVSADGRLLAAVMAGGQHQAAWLTGTPRTDAPLQLPALTDAPHIGDPGNLGWPAVSSGVALAVSPNARYVVATALDGSLYLYAADRRLWSNGPHVAAGRRVVAVSDNGNRMVLDDGQVVAGGTTHGSLAGFVPLGQYAGGFALTEDGRYALVYGYAVTGEGTAQRAERAAVQVVDLGTAAAVNLADATVVGAVALVSAVGCTAAPAAGETCQHAAALTVAPGGGSVFLVGPRGVAAAPLPQTLQVQPAAIGGRNAGAWRVR